MAGVVLDSSVVIALLKPADKHHYVAQEAVAGSEEKVTISTITLTEVLVRPAQLSHSACSEMADELYSHFGEPISLSSQIAIAAALVRARTGLSTPDAIISATASVNMATLWTCDARLAKLHKGARLIA